MAEMRSLDYHSSLCGWICRLVISSDPQMSALSPTVADLTTTTNIVHCVTENSHRNKLRQRGD